MANSADVGKLRLIMEADTAQLESSVDDVQSRLDRFATRIGITAGVVEKAMDLVIDAVTGAVGAVIDGFSNALKAAGDLDDLSQRVGIAAGRLSELKYAADITGTPITTLTTGLQKLAKVMQDVAGGDVKGPAARALDAIGVSATDASGKVRDMDTVLLEVADKFASYRDSAQKSALAVMLFGEQGTKLLPFLNEGREGLGKLADEAQKFGVALSTGAIRQAAELGDNLAKLDQAGQTFYRQVMTQVTPALVTLTKELLGTKQGYSELSLGAWAASGAISGSARAALAAINIFRELSAWASALGGTMGALASLDFDGAARKAEEGAKKIQEAIDQTKASIFEFNREFEKQPAFGAAGASGLQDYAPAGKVGEDGKGDAPRAQGSTELANAQRLANEELARGNQLWREGTALIQETMTPLELYHQQLEKINKLQAANAISADQAARAQAKAAQVLTSAYANAAASIVGDLGKVFENNKAVAIAAALINTYQAVTNAWANVPWPLNIAAAGAALAAGMAQVQNIRNTNKGGGGGGGGGGAGGGSSATGPTQAPQLVNVTLHGSRFSRDEVRDLIGQLNEAAADGAIIKVN